MYVCDIGFGIGFSTLSGVGIGSSTIVGESVPSVTFTLNARINNNNNAVDRFT